MTNKRLRGNEILGRARAEIGIALEIELIKPDEFAFLDRDNISARGVLERMASNGTEPKGMSCAVRYYLAKYGDVDKESTTFALNVLEKYNDHHKPHSHHKFPTY